MSKIILLSQLKAKPSEHILLSIGESPDKRYFGFDKFKNKFGKINKYPAWEYGTLNTLGAFELFHSLYYNSATASYYVAGGSTHQQNNPNFGHLTMRVGDKDLLFNLSVSNGGYVTGQTAAVGDVFGFTNSIGKTLPVLFSPAPDYYNNW